MWKHLTHRNIVPLLGVTISPFQLVSDWMPGGHLPDYIRMNPDADRLGLVGVPAAMPIPYLLQSKLSDVAEGLCYLHSRNMVHGDLKGVRGRSESHFTTGLTPG